MLQLANDHDARLDAAKGDPDILALYTPFHAALLIFRTLMAVWFSSRGIGKGLTQTWEELLDDMTKDWIDIWQGMVFAIYPSGTPEATAIFPQKKAPFQSGKYDERMMAIDALYVTLLNYPALEAVATAVNAKIIILTEVRKIQREQFGRTDFSGNNIEAQRVVLANLMDNNLGDLKKKYRSNISLVESYYDLALLRKVVNDSDAVFNASGAVEAGATSAIAIPQKMNLSANATSTFTNRSNLAELQFFFSASASAADNPIKTTVLPNESASGTVAESGWAPGTNFIIVKNIGTVTAEFEGFVM